MEITKEQRHSIYIAALAFYKNRISEGNYFGFCDALESVASKLLGWDNYPDPYIEMEAYPEIFKHRPDNSDGYWFDKYGDGVKKRIAIFEEAIELTK